jgi:hypothetical protein
MNATEHYHAAETLVERADALVETAADQHGEESAINGFHMVMARAQVHATLALAGAVRESGAALPDRT